MTQPTHDPAAEYGRRLQERRARAERHERVDRAIGNARLAMFCVALAVAWAGYGQGWVSPAWLLLPAAAFVALVAAHDGPIRAARLARRAAAFYEAGLAKIQGRWAGAGVAGDEFLDPRHPCAADLDIFGPASLFERLCSARTRAGQETLARWLLAPAGAAVIGARQEAVAELGPRLDLREDLAILGERVAAGTDLEAVAAWGESPARFGSAAWSWQRVAVLLLSLSLAVAGLAWSAGRTGGGPFLSLLVLAQLAVSPLRDRVREALRDAERAGRDLSLFTVLLARLETEHFAAPRLGELATMLGAAGARAGGRAGQSRGGSVARGGEPPSRRVARLRLRVELLESLRNQFLALIGFALLLPFHLAFAIEAWRAENGRWLGGWLEASGEFEALCSLAAYHYECPADPFPEVVEAGPLFAAEGLAHPLLPVETAVRNDLALGEPIRLLIVSGSNMSGKSTLLRAAGTNAVLALAGAPVRARSLRLCPLVVGASLRIQDSLQAGTSRFYAEIARLRQMVDLAVVEIPLFFLLDELLQGTNSHDRRIGAAAVLRTLVERGAIGMATTHDLALAAIADELAPRAANVHFADQLEDGRISFDYRLRPGVVQRGNALALMRAVGLDV